MQRLTGTQCFNKNLLQVINVLHEAHYWLQTHSLLCLKLSMCTCPCRFGAPTLNFSWMWPNRTHFAITPTKEGCAKHTVPLSRNSFKQSWKAPFSSQFKYLSSTSEFYHWQISAKFWRSVHSRRLVNTCKKGWAFLSKLNKYLLTLII